MVYPNVAIGQICGLSMTWPIKEKPGIRFVWAAPEESENLVRRSRGYESLNRVELAVYNFVKGNPKLKMGIRNAYQSVCDLVPVKSVVSPYAITVREGFFFGFHDKCPWSADNSKLLANRLEIPLRMPRADDRLGVGYFTGENHADFHPVAETRAWNYQQGCMLQWVGKSDSFIFNDFDGAAHVARIHDASGKLINTVPVPIGAVSPNGKSALSYSFERSKIYAPGYGYPNGIDPEKDVQKPATHGIQMVDLASGKARQLFSVKEIAALEPDASMENAFHYLTHCRFSPSGNRFVFFHRWIRDFNFLRTRMISSDLDGGDLFIFPTDGMVSHVGWRDDGRVLAYARVKPAGDRYVLFEDRTGAYELIGEKHFNSDGHPSFSPDRRWIVTDTYPDRFRVCNLILFDTQTGRRLDLARLKSPRMFAAPNFEKNWHCDLHPRWNRTGSEVCFDSAHTGSRALCTLRLGGLDAGEPKHID